MVESAEIADDNKLEAVSLDEIHSLPQIAGAFYVYETEEKWSIRFRVIRDHRKDGSVALHPQITASDGN